MGSLPPEGARAVVPLNMEWGTDLAGVLQPGWPVCLHRLGRRAGTVPPGTERMSTEYQISFMTRIGLWVFFLLLLFGCFCVGCFFFFLGRVKLEVSFFVLFLCNENTPNENQNLKKDLLKINHP